MSLRHINITIQLEDEQVTHRVEIEDTSLLMGPGAAEEHFDKVVELARVELKKGVDSYE